MGWLGDVWDSVFAPGGAGVEIDHHPSTPMSGGGGASDWGYQQEPDWHNNFGTAADYQVPAESGDMFQSWGWGGG